MIEGESAALPPGRLAEEIAELCRRDDGAVLTFERLLNSVVTWSYRDREALVDALGPPAGASGGKAPLLRPRGGWLLRHIVSRGIQSARADEPGGSSGAGWLELCQHEAMDYAFGARTGEIVRRLRLGDAMPCLLSEASRPGGAVEPHDLVARLGTYERAGARPGAADLGLALLRCGGGPAEPGVVRAAERLELPEGPRVVTWLRQGGLPHPAWSRERESGEPERPSRRRGARVGRRILVGTEAIEGRGEFPRQFWSLFRKFEPHIPCPYRGLHCRDRYGVSVLPWHPEIVAARQLSDVASAADRDGQGDPVFLPALAMSEGPVGPAVHLAVAYGLAAAPDEDRLAAARAAVLLAGRDRLDGALLGREIAELVRLGTLKVPLLTASLRAAAAAPGGAAPVWDVLASALPGLLACTRPQLHGALLAVAADCALRSGARGAVPEVTALAERTGSSQLVAQARRLRDALAGA
ncbi:hypothetical protein ACFU5O_22740 [Streptomyces sp. NPDC057445]|uniref:hypothetical protein n=1 Tax=Streptomyces sp. NPDC057445 TaxID=3346136 RepID=UPI0036AB981B